MTKKLLSIFLAITISSNLLSMNKFDGFKSTITFDLKLNQKPNNTSVYDWCTEKTKELVREKRLAILKLFGKESQEKEKQWEKMKKEAEDKFFKKEALNQSEKLKNNYLPKYLKDEILELLKNDYIKKALSIEKISISNRNVIELYIEKNKDPIYFLCDNYKDELISPARTNAYFNIIFSAKALNDDTYDKGCFKAFTGHELVHIIYKHPLEEYCFDNLCEVKSKELSTNKYTFESTFKDYLCDFKRAQEIQADIIGIFNDPELAFKMKEHFYNEKKTLESNNINSFKINKTDIHPNDGQRYKYFNEIYEALINEKFSN